MESEEAGLEGSGEAGLEGLGEGEAELEIGEDDCCEEVSASETGGGKLEVFEREE